jgi:hypothetical protein
VTATRMSTFPYQVSNPAAIERTPARPIIRKVDDDKALLLALIERAAEETKNRWSKTTPRGARANLHRTPGQRNQKPACLPESRNQCTLGPQQASHRRPNRHPDPIIPRLPDSSMPIC